MCLSSDLLVFCTVRAMSSDVICENSASCDVTSSNSRLHTVCIELGYVRVGFK